MNKKIFVLVMTLGMITTAISIPLTFNVAATDNYGDPEIDHMYVFNKTEILSEIVTNQLYSKWGRFFGTGGEVKAADYLREWMENIGLDCVHNETINFKTS